jgi:hypothetical protein
VRSDDAPGPSPAVFASTACNCKGGDVHSRHRGDTAGPAGTGRRVGGQSLEWYEFGVYGYFATIIAARFFTPEGGSEIEGLVTAYASFAPAFFFRPVGAALFGHLGDSFNFRGGRALSVG